MALTATLGEQGLGAGFKSVESEVKLRVTSTILITGATGGLGLALAKAYAPTSRLLLVGRKPLSELEDNLFSAETYCQADLSKPDSAEIVAAFLEHQAITELELLIHNAGQGYYGKPETQSAENIDQLLNVNLHAPMLLTHKLLPHLKKAKGKLVFISSISANLPAADYAVYSATKAALGGFARNLRLELGPSVHVQTLYPGAIRTEMHAKSGVPAGKYNPETFPSVEEIAQQVMRAVETDVPEVTLGFSNRLLRTAGRTFASSLDAVLRMMRR